MYGLAAKLVKLISIHSTLPRDRTHVAALALLGWSLIAPPPLPSSWWSTYWPWSAGNGWNLEAPLSQWTKRDTFESLENCQRALGMMRDENAVYLPSSTKAWQCVSADDAHEGDHGR